MALSECLSYRYFSYSYSYSWWNFSVTVTVTVNRLDLFPLMVISVTVTVNLNHTAQTMSFYYYQRNSISRNSCTCFIKTNNITPTLTNWPTLCPINSQAESPDLLCILTSQTSNLTHFRSYQQSDWVIWPSLQSHHSHSKSYDLVYNLITVTVSHLTYFRSYQQSPDLLYVITVRLSHLTHSVSDSH